MRKAIDELGAAAARDRIALAIGVQREAVGFLWQDDRVRAISLTRRGEKPRDLNTSEIQAIAAAGVLLGAGGWEIEEESEIRRLCDAFVAELRAELAPKPEPSANDEDGGAESMVPREELDAMAERAMKYQRKEEGARFSLATMLGCAGMWSEIEKKIEALKRKPSPSPRTTDGALTAYLLAHYRDEWRTDDTAEILAIRLLGETQRIVDEAHEEAERSDKAAKEMAAELGKVRAEITAVYQRAEVAEAKLGRATEEILELRRDLNTANARAAEAEHDRRRAFSEADEARRLLAIEAKERDEALRTIRASTRERDEARADLATLRGLCRGFAAKIGAPHG